MFSHRALEGLAVYDIWETRVTVEYLKAYVAERKAIRQKVNLSIDDVTDITLLDRNLEERLSFALPPTDIIYQFAAVMFFDDSESPYKYDPEYAKEKIALWRANKDVDDFFFSMPIKDLIPSHFKAFCN